MKQVSAALKALIEGGRFVQGKGFPSGFVPFDCYTITTSSGLVLTYTTADFKIAAPTPLIFTAPPIYAVNSWQQGVYAAPEEPNVWFPGISWSPAPIDFTGTKATAHYKRGLDADNWTVKFAPRPQGSSTADLIGAEPWLAAAAAGALNRADCLVSRAYFAAMPTWPMPSAGAVPVGMMTLFRGYLGEVDLSTTSALLTINDYRMLFQGQMPRNYYQPQCPLLFGSARCGVDLTLYTKTGTTTSASARAQIVASATITAPGGSNTFELGVLTMTSGRNSGFSRHVARWDNAAVFSLLSPFPYPVAAGETFEVSAGCPKTIAACTSFANLANFKGDPFLPVPDIALQ